MDAKKVAGKLVTWIQEQVKSAGGKGCVFGMSGGIDSSVVAALCRRSHPDNLLGVIMPCHSDPKDAEHAGMVAKKFSVPFRKVVLDDIFDNLLGTLPEVETAPENIRTAHVNLKPRLRMLTLYYLANQLNYLVIGSGNRDELTVGYFTKYGDGGVDILPLGALLKSEIRELARFLDVPREIIDKAPSAGLWPGQTDEGEMGLTYDVLDGYLGEGKAPALWQDKIEAMVRASAHKRSMPPIADI